MLYSVIIPVYNRRHLLERAIRSVFDDLCDSVPRNDFEIIVVDDGSTDDTAEGALSFGAPVKLLQQNHKGPQAARNRGLQYSSGRYVRFLDSDDCMEKGATQAQLVAMGDSNADIVYGDWYDEYETRSGQQASTRFRSRSVWIDATLELLNDKWCAPFCYLIRGDLARSQMWHLHLTACQDFDYFLQLALRGSTFRHTPVIAGFYSHHSGARVSSSSQLRWAHSKVLTLERAISILNRENGWTLDYRNAIAASLHRTAKLLYRDDRVAYQRTLYLAHTIYPEYRPEGLLYPLLIKMAGYEGAERFLDLRRRLFAGRSRA